MTDQWTPNGNKWPQPAMVMVRSIGHGWYSAAVGNNGAGYHVPEMLLHAMPPTIAPEQQAVLDAAKKQESAGSSTGENIAVADYDAACRNTNEAVRTMLAAQQPPDPVKELRKAWNANREHGWHDRMEAAIAALEAKS